MIKKANDRPNPVIMMGSRKPKYTCSPMAFLYVAVD
jgi:hypothetical protein